MEGENLVNLVCQCIITLTGAKEKERATTQWNQDGQQGEKPLQFEHGLAGPDELSQVIRIKNAALCRGFELSAGSSSLKHNRRKPRPPIAPAPSSSYSRGTRPSSGQGDSMSRAKSMSKQKQKQRGANCPKEAVSAITKYWIHHSFQEGGSRTDYAMGKEQEKTKEARKDNDTEDVGGTSDDDVSTMQCSEDSDNPTEDTSIAKTPIIDLFINLPDGTKLVLKSVNEKLDLVEVELNRFFSLVQSIDRRNLANSARNFVLMEISLVVEQRRYVYHLYNGSTICKLLDALHSTHGKKIETDGLIMLIFGNISYSNQHPQTQTKDASSRANISSSLESSRVSSCDNMLPSLRGAVKHYAPDQYRNRIYVLLTKFSDFLIGEAEKEKYKQLVGTGGVYDFNGLDVPSFSAGTHPYTKSQRLPPYLQSGSTRPSSRCSSAAGGFRHSRQGRSSCYSMGNVNGNRSVVKSPREKFFIPIAPPSVPVSETRRPMSSSWNEGVVEKALHAYRSVPLPKQNACGDENGIRDNVNNVNNDTTSHSDSSGENQVRKDSCGVSTSVEEQCLISLGKIQIVNALIRFEKAHCGISDQFGKVLSKETLSFLKEKWQDIASITAPEMSMLQPLNNRCGLYGCEVYELPIKCDRCKSVFYCSKAHQTAHMAVHIPICPIIIQSKCEDGIAIVNTNKQRTTKGKAINGDNNNNTHANRKNQVNSCGHRACRRYCLYFKKVELTEEQKLKRELKRELSLKP